MYPVVDTFVYEVRGCPYCRPRNKHMMSERDMFTAVNNRHFAILNVLSAVRLV